MCDHSFKGFTNRQFQFPDSSLQPQQVLLQLSLLLLQNTYLSLQFLVLGPLIAQIFLELIFHSLSLVHQVISHVSCLLSEHVF